MIQVLVTAAVYVVVGLAAALMLEAAIEFLDNLFR